MKNIIYIVVDSIFEECLGENKCGVSTTPFLDKFSQKCYVGKNFYSEAPFTEAALMATFSGQHTLSNGGYINKFEDTQMNLFKYYYEKGYDTYYNVFPNYWDMNKFPELTHPAYTSGPYFSTVGLYRLKYYSDRIKGGYQLCKEDYRNIEINLKLIIGALKVFFEDYLEEKSERFELIDEENFKEIDVQEQKRILDEELCKLCESPQEYVDNYFEKGEKHVLQTIAKVRQKRIYNSKIWYDYLNTEYADFLERAIEFERKCNNKNLNISFKYLLNKIGIFLKSKDLEDAKNIYRYLRNFYKITLKRNELRTFDENGELQKDLPSAKRTFRYYLQKLEQRQDENPFLVKIHVDDCHFHPIYFSYDIEEKDVVDKEMAILKEYLEKLDSRYEGSIAYDFSLLYMDHCIEEFISGLEKMDLLENTTIVITADHGYSYSKRYTRENFVNNFYRENYHIPMFIYDKDIVHQIDEGIHSSVDIIPSLINVTDGECSEARFEGESVFCNEQKKYVLSEYMGMGCPDFVSRNAFLGIRTEEFVVIYSVSINGDFKDGYIECLFDIKKDPEQYVNLRNHKSVVKKVEPLLEILKVRHSEIKESYQNLK